VCQNSEKYISNIISSLVRKTLIWGLDKFSAGSSRDRQNSIADGPAGQFLFGFRNKNHFYVPDFKVCLTMPAAWGWRCGLAATVSRGLPLLAPPRLRVIHTHSRSQHTGTGLFSHPL
jgi:hypothetical protein